MKNIKLFENFLNEAKEKPKPGFYDFDGTIPIIVGHTKDGKAVNNNEFTSSDHADAAKLFRKLMKTYPKNDGTGRYANAENKAEKHEALAIKLKAKEDKED